MIELLHAIGIIVSKIDSIKVVMVEDFYKLFKLPSVVNYYTILYYTILYYTILYYTILYYIVELMNSMHVLAEMVILPPNFQRKKRVEPDIHRKIFLGTRNTPVKQQVTKEVLRHDLKADKNSLDIR